MLDKIKVYRRSDAKEINGEQIRIGFGESLWLFVGPDSTPQEEKFKLTKTDPLNKFKKEMEGWLFCEEYVVIEMYNFTLYNNVKPYCGTESLGWFDESHKLIYIDIKCYANNPAIHYIQVGGNEIYASLNHEELSSIEYGHNSTLYLDKFNEKEALTLAKSFYEKKKSPPKPIKNKLFYEILEIIKPYFDYDEKVKRKNGNNGVIVRMDYTIGEDKYIKLLELINQ